jgi:hypothetical protein
MECGELTSEVSQPNQQGLEVDPLGEVVMVKYLLVFVVCEASNLELEVVRNRGTHRWEIRGCFLSRV